MVLVHRVLSVYSLTEDLQGSQCRALLPTSAFTVVITEGGVPSGLWLGKGAVFSKMLELFGFRTWGLVTLNGGLQGHCCPWTSRQGRGKQASHVGV